MSAYQNPEQPLSQNLEHPANTPSGAAKNEDFVAHTSGRSHRDFSSESLIFPGIKEEFGVEPYAFLGSPIDNILNDIKTGQLVDSPNLNLDKLTVDSVIEAITSTIGQPLDIHKIIENGVKTIQLMESKIYTGGVPGFINRPELSNLRTEPNTGRIIGIGTRIPYFLSLEIGIGDQMDSPDGNNSRTKFLYEDIYVEVVAKLGNGGRTQHYVDLKTIAELCLANQAQSITPGSEVEA
jgi:hypothetical protein